MVRPPERAIPKPPWQRSIADPRPFAWIVAVVVWFACTAAFVPPGLRVAIDSPQRITLAVPSGVLSSVTLCPNYAFDTLGVGGPTVSPDLHWILVDIKGPFEPANVAVTHALIEVTTGAVVTAPDFPTYLGVPSTRDPLAWASGERATLRYKGDTLATVHDPPLHPIPPLVCGPLR